MHSQNSKREALPKRRRQRLPLPSRPARSFRLPLTVRQLFPALPFLSPSGASLASLGEGKWEIHKQLCLNDLSPTIHETSLPKTRKGKRHPALNPTPRSRFPDFGPAIFDIGNWKFDLVTRISVKLRTFAPALRQPK